MARPHNRALLWCQRPAKRLKLSCCHDPSAELDFLFRGEQGVAADFLQVSGQAWVAGFQGFRCSGRAGTRKGRPWVATLSRPLHCDGSEGQRFPRERVGCSRCSRCSRCSLPALAKLRQDTPSRNSLNHKISTLLPVVRCPGIRSNSARYIKHITLSHAVTGLLRIFIP